MNLLSETIEVLKSNGKTLEDITFVYTNEGCFTPSNCETFLDLDYDDDFGRTEIRSDLKLVGKDFWLERAEYDGSEWWEFKQLPVFNKMARTKISPYNNH